MPESLNLMPTMIFQPSHSDSVIQKEYHEVYNDLNGSNVQSCLLKVSDQNQNKFNVVLHQHPPQTLLTQQSAHNEINFKEHRSIQNVYTDQLLLIHTLCHPQCNNLHIQYPYEQHQEMLVDDELE